MKNERSQYVDEGKAALRSEPRVDLAGPGLQGNRARGADNARRDVPAAISAFEETMWSLVRFTLYRDAPLISGDGQIYRVGHMSLPA